MWPMKTLADFTQKMEGIVEDLEGDSILTQRLRELGIHRGVPVRMLGQAPFKGPFLYQIHNSVIALRRREAECVKVKVKA